MTTSTNDQADGHMIKPLLLEPVNPVKAPEQETPDGADGLNPVNASTAQEGSQPRQLPYDDAPFLAHHLHQNMEPAVFLQFARVVMGMLREQSPDEFNALLGELTEQQMA
jgi:ParB family chromosome partitioning protein